MPSVQSDPTSLLFVIQKYVLLLLYPYPTLFRDLSDGRASVINGLGGSFRCGWGNIITNISRCLRGLKWLVKPSNAAKMDFRSGIFFFRPSYLTKRNARHCQSVRFVL